MIILECVYPSIRKGNNTAITRLRTKAILKNLNDNSLINRSDNLLEPNLSSIFSMHPITKGYDKAKRVETMDNTPLYV